MFLSLLKYLLHGLSGSTLLDMVLQEVSLLLVGRALAYNQYLLGLFVTLSNLQIWK